MIFFVFSLRLMPLLASPTQNTSGMPLNFYSIGHVPLHSKSGTFSLGISAMNHAMPSSALPFQSTTRSEKGVFASRLEIAIIILHPSTIFRH